MNPQNKIKLLTGSKFGRWTVVCLSKNNLSRGNDAAYLCKCDCGKEKIVLARNLLNGQSTSCRCKQKLSKEEKSKRLKFRNYRSNAKHRKKSFELTEDDVWKLCNGFCHYCGSNKNENGIDRINNSIGYIISNCVSCCKLCNYAKRTLTLMEFYEWLDQIALYRSRKIIPESKCKKILITGSHGVGKSTLSFRLTSLIKEKYPAFNVSLNQENAREVSLSTNGELNNSFFQILSITKSLEAELIKSQHSDIIVCDRTTIDPIVYGEYYNVEDLAALKTLAINNLKTFDLVYFIRPTLSERTITEDGFRDTDIDNRNEIDTLFEKILTSNKIRYNEITTDQLNKYNFINDIKKLYE